MLLFQVIFSSSLPADFEISFSGHFRQFDHGVLNNLDIYNEPAPPDYDLTLVTAPVAIYYAKNDWLVAETVSIHV